MTHKFVVGQAVDFGRQLRSMSAGPYEVVSVPPVDGTDAPTYRVKSKTEPFTRVAKETELVAVGSAPSKDAVSTLWGDLVSGRGASPPLRTR